MAVQYIYPIWDLNTNFTNKSTDSSSGCYTYIDEGVSTYVDSDYIYTSGIPISYNYSGYVYHEFGFLGGPISVTPSSVQLNLRARYMPATYSGVVTANAYLLCSGDWRNTYGAFNPVETTNIFASSVSPATIASGATFSTYTFNLAVNPLLAQAYDRYGQSVIKVDFKITPNQGNGYEQGTLAVSAVEAVVSGNTLIQKMCPLQLLGGHNYRLWHDRLYITHQTIENNSDTSFSISDNGYEAYDEQYITGMRFFNAYQGSYGSLLNYSPLLCLTSGTINVSDIFRDAYFDFSTRPSTLNNIKYNSSTSSHQINVASDLIIGASSLCHIGQPFAYGPYYNADHGLDDSYVTLRNDVTVTCSGMLPSGTFSMFVGVANILSLAGQGRYGNIITDEDNDFQLGRNNLGFYASLLDSEGNRRYVYNYNQAHHGFIVSYTGVLSLYALQGNGNVIENFQPSVSFARTSKTSPSGNIYISTGGISELEFVSGAVQNMSNYVRLYKFGVVASGISAGDIGLLNRHNLFNTIIDNLDIVPSSTSHCIQFKSYNDRNPYTSDYYTTTPYSVGDAIYFGRGTLTNNPGVVDNDIYFLKINKYNAPYTDVSVSCHISGNNNNYYQDGQLYFSGWIDTLTTNPSGLLPSNLFVRLAKDNSTISNLYDPEYSSGYYQTSNYTSYNYPVADNYNRVYQEKAGPSFTGIFLNQSSSSVLYTSVDDTATASSSTKDLDYIWCNYSSAIGATLNLVAGYSDLGFRVDLPSIIFNNISGCATLTVRAAYLGDTGNTPYNPNYNYANIIYKSNSIYGTNTGIIASGNIYSNYYASGNNGSFIDYQIPLTVNTGVYASQPAYLYFRASFSGAIYSYKVSSVFLTLNGLQTLYIPPTYETPIYDKVLRARGKVASCNISLGTGLRMYTQAMDSAMYYYDEYVPSATAYQQGYTPIYTTYDKTAIKHLTWDNCDIGMYYIGYNDVLNSGYRDTVKIYNSVIMSDNWSHIEISGKSNSNTLYIEGDIGVSGNTDLYLHNRLESNNTPLYLLNIVQTSSTVPLIMECGSANKSLDLYMNSVYASNSGVNLYTQAGMLIKSMPLYMQRESYPGFSGGLNLFIYSTTNSGLMDYFDLYMNSDGVSKLVPLLLKSKDNDANTGYFPIYIKSGGDSSNSIPLVISQSGGITTSTQRLYIGGAGTTEGAYIGTSNFPMYIGDGNNFSEKVLPLVLQTRSGLYAGMNICMSGGSYATDNLDLVIGSSTGKLNNNMTLYSHGF